MTLEPMHREIERFTKPAHHLDAVCAYASLSLRECISNALSWQPTWLKILFLARGGLARLMRIEHPSSRPGRPLRPEEISFRPGDRLAFFTVSAGKEDAFIVLTAEDTHLVGHLIVEEDPTDTGTERRFRIITAVRYRRWTGLLYFNIIRPFHHIIMHRMIAAASRPGEPVR
ncbi:DUF2867 domain-containing protein [Arthrobacter sp. ES3-54]|jgi:Protein of unknown function (DUF2867)|uniref:DUF2867 domain-containing protein n=1 Tax=Arthrobacter sp. ES3-54 TaxID=1502991 RepID=UPI00240741BA|nr:DUF2867 domain-containing protein [Arthrobacter sp. ES3-54]MDF9752377.1 hypothetical protein [Arthrobacter sp. ES3-54]